MVAAAVFLYIHRAVISIDIGGEAVLATAGWAGESGADAGVFEKVVAVVHTLSSSENGSRCSGCSTCSASGTGGTDGTGSGVSAGMVMLFSFAFLRRRKTVVLAISRAEAISRTDLPSRWSFRISMISS